MIRRYPSGLALRCLAVVLGLLLSLPRAEVAQAQAAPPWAEDLLRAWYAAYNAGDIQGVARLYTEDAVVGTNRGRAAYAADLATRFAKVKATCTGAFDGFQVAGASAVGWGRDQCTETPKAGGPEVKTRTKWIAVYARQPDGRWLTARDEGEPLEGESLEATASSHMDRWIRLWVERDLEGYLALYDPSAKMVFWGTHFPNLDSLRAVARSVMDSRTNESWTLDQIVVKVLSPTSVLVQSVSHGKWNERNSGNEARRRGYLTALLERRETSWKIVALHNHLSQ